MTPVKIKIKIIM